MNQFLLGILTMASGTAALLFLRFWRLTFDRLFILFALAFSAFALNWIELSLAAPALEGRHVHFLLRLVGFIFIILGILDKTDAKDELQRDNVAYCETPRDLQL